MRIFALFALAVLAAPLASQLDTNLATSGGPTCYWTHCFADTSVTPNELIAVGGWDTSCTSGCPTVLGPTYIGKMSGGTPTWGWTTPSITNPTSGTAVRWVGGSAVFAPKMENGVAWDYGYMLTHKGYTSGNSFVSGKNGLLFEWDRTGGTAGTWTIKTPTGGPPISSCQFCASHTQMAYGNGRIYVAGDLGTSGADTYELRKAITSPYALTWTKHGSQSGSTGAPTSSGTYGGNLIFCKGYLVWIPGSATQDVIYTDCTADGSGNYLWVKTGTKTTEQTAGHNNMWVDLNVNEAITHIWSDSGGTPFRPTPKVWARSTGETNWNQLLDVTGTASSATSRSQGIGTWYKESSTKSYFVYASGKDESASPGALADTWKVVLPHTGATTWKAAFSYTGSNCGAITSFYYNADFPPYVGATVDRVVVGPVSSNLVWALGPCIDTACSGSCRQYVDTLSPLTQLFFKTTDGAGSYTHSLAIPNLTILLGTDVCDQVVFNGSGCSTLDWSRQIKMHFGL